MFLEFWLQCNNPKTKEPKLQAAQRIVAEWVDYDTEIKRLWDEVNNRNITIDAEPDTTTPSKFYDIGWVRYSDLNLEFGILNWN